jgi:hypothetical protein
VNAVVALTAIGAWLADKLTGRFLSYRTARRNAEAKARTAEGAAK